MSHVFFTRELEGVATFWRIYRRDGSALGFTSHDRDLRFGGITHRAAPGMVPSAIRRGAGLADDSADIEGVLSDVSITEADLRAGRYDNARIEVGAVDWESMEHAVLYSGTIGAIREESGAFSAELRSAKAVFEADYIPRTSPTCRARFCGPGCTLSAAFHTQEAILISSNPDSGAFTFDLVAPADFVWGDLVWLDGPAAGIRMAIIGEADGALLLDHPVAAMPLAGAKARLRKGCDHTLATCTVRFNNAINFQGEPYLPGNDLLARYPLAQ